jgi:hypothetical protein
MQQRDPSSNTVATPDQLLHFWSPERAAPLHRPDNVANGYKFSGQYLLLQKTSN